MKTNLHCSICQSTFEIKSSQQLENSKEYEIPHRLIEATILAGINQTQLTQQSVLTGFQSLSRSTFFKVTHKLQKKVNEFAEEKLEQNKNMIRKREQERNTLELEKVPLCIAIDARWTNPRGYNSEEGTVTVLDVESGKALWVVHCMRARSKEYWYRNYKRSVRAMEGHGVFIVVKEMKEQNFIIKRFAHDNDASTKKHILAQFPNAIEDLCVGHGAKGFREKIVEASKEFQS